VLKSLTSTVGFRGWVAVCGSGNEMDSPLAKYRAAIDAALEHDRVAFGFRSPEGGRCPAAPGIRGQRQGLPTVGSVAILLNRG